MPRRKNIDNEDDSKNNESMILIYRHNDECYIERGAYCYALVVHAKRMYYPNIGMCFKALSHALLVDHFGRIPNEEKNDIKRIVRVIEEHDKMIKEMFKGY